MRERERVILHGSVRGNLGRGRTVGREKFEGDKIRDQEIERKCGKLGGEKKLVVKKRFSGRMGRKREDEQEGRENRRREREITKKKLRVRCKEIERKRKNAGNVEYTRRAYNVIQKENRERERNFPRRGDERRVGNSSLERDREREKGGRGRTNSEIEQETKSGRIQKRKSWIEREDETNRKIGERGDSGKMNKKEKIGGREFTRAEME